MKAETPALGYGRRPRRWRGRDTLFLAAILLLVAYLACFRYVPWGIFDIRIGLGHS